jgi:hypothetical protein
MSYGDCILHKTILHKTIMLGMFLILAVGLGHAQSGIRVNVPFDFASGGQTFPSGQYTLKPLPQFPHTMLLQSQSGRTLSYIGTNPMQSRDVAGSTKLIFNRYGGQFFLTQMWIAGSEIGWETMKSPVEIQLAKYSSGQPVEVSSLNRR